MFGFLKQLVFNKMNIKSPNVKFAFFSRIGVGSSFEGNNRVGKFSFVTANVGRCSYIGDNVVIMSGCIGRYTSISSNVRVINGKHPIKTSFVSTSPVFYAKQTPLGISFVEEQLFEEYAYIDKDKKTQILIGNDCWIGYGVSIIGGVTIGDGAVVLANATVTKDVPPYSIVGGVPAKVIGYRFDAATIEKMLTIKWWEKEENWIKERIHCFSNVEEFCSHT